MTRRSNDGRSESATGRIALWMGLLALITVVCLLMAIHQVMRAAVLQGESLRKTHAAYAEAAWRCNSSRSVTLRESCKAKLTALPEPEAATQDQKVAAAGTGQVKLPLEGSSQEMP